MNLPGSQNLLDHAALERMPASDGLSGHLELMEVPPHKRVLFLAAERGPVSLWAQPRQDLKYIVGACWFPDWPVAFVIDQREGVQVAMFRESCTPAEFANQVAMLGRFYGWAFLVPGVDEDGFCDALLRGGYPPELIFNRRRAAAALGVGTGGDEYAGFEMTDVSRVQLIHALQEGVRGTGISVAIRSPITIEECREFAIQPDGKLGLAGGSHAGCVWAAALAVFALQRAPRVDPAGVRRLRGFEAPGGRKR